VTAITVTAPGSHYPSTGVVITIDPPSAALPAGTGWATMTVTESGAVTLAGLLGDGTHFSAGASISTAVGVDSFAFYLPLYVTTKLAPPGSIGGTFAFEPETDSDCDGMLYWIKPAQPTAALYPSGFSTSVSFAAASYAAPTTGLPLQFSSATAPTAQIVFSGGDLTAPITDALSFSGKGAITETGATADKLKLTLNHKTGLLTGSLLPVPKSPSATISGVIYQKTNAGVGLFLGPSQSSRFTLSPQ
jgi:hypothetical protein